MGSFLGKFLKNKKEAVKIGNLTPMSGDYGYYGEWEKRGIDLAVGEINKSGGVNGCSVEVVRADDRADPVACVEALNKLIHIHKVQAIIGPISSDAVIAAAPFAKKNQVVLISAIAAAAQIPAADGYFFSIFPTAEREGKSLVEAAAARGNKTAAIIYINNAYGMELAKTVRREAPAAGIEILAAEGYKQDAADFSGQLARVREKDPHTVFLLGYPKDMALILKQAQAMNMKLDFFAPDTFDDPALKAIAGQAARRVAYAMPSNEFLPEFRAAFKAKYSQEPNFVDAMTYDAVKLLVLAIARGGNNGQAIKNELLKIKDYSGATGAIAFDENGRVINRLIDVVQNGD